MDQGVSILTNFATPWDLKNRHKNTTTTSSTTTTNHSHCSKVEAQTTSVPKSFIWSLDDIGKPKEKMVTPLIDLDGFVRGDKMATKRAAELVKVACSNHGFFQVINHGIEANILDEALNNMYQFFNLPPTQKAGTLKMPGNPWGLSIAHADRLSTNLPWKETLSFPHHAKDNDDVVVEYFTLVLGLEFKPMGMVYRKYCNEMYKLASIITELLAISLGVDQSYYRDFFEDARSIMRLNYYPPCDEPNLVLGTGPHCDPTSLTLLHQDQVGGLEVFVDNKWKIVEPLADALLINIGDTLMAMTNGEYKSCLHRAVVNKNVERKSMAFFLCPKEDKIVRPPKGLDNPRKYPDFTWSQFFGFTQKHYRADGNTLESFKKWSCSRVNSEDSTKIIQDELQAFRTIYEFADK